MRTAGDRVEERGKKGGEEGGKGEGQERGCGQP